MLREAMAWLGKRFWIFANIAAFFFAVFIQSYDPDHSYFLPKVLGTLFTVITYTAGSFILLFLVFRKRMPIALFCAQLFAAFWVYLQASGQHTMFDLMNKTLDKVFIKPVFDFNFVHAATSNGTQLGPLFYGLYAGVALLIYGNWFVRKKKLKDGYWKIERQVIWTGLGVYGIINLMIWMFTHFSFVGSNYINMEYLMKYVDKIVVQYDKEDRRDMFAVKDLRYFERFEDIKAYYRRPEFLARSGGDDRRDFYNTVYDTMDQIEKNGFHGSKPVTYQSMTRFHDWMGVVFNTNYNGADPKLKTAWLLELSSSVTSAPNWQDVARHSLFYIKQRDNGHYYVYFSFDRSFKDYRSNYLFNFFFIIFHLVFLPLFGYLVYLHRRDNLKKSPIASELAGEEG